MNEKLGQLITVSEPRSPISEAYRTLRTNLDFAGLDRKLQTLVITSAGVGEGKSTTLANLAVVTAQAGQKVILVDADLRRPSLHGIFGLANDTGLTTMMMDEVALASPPLQDTGIEGESLVKSQGDDMSRASSTPLTRRTLLINLAALALFGHGGPPCRTRFVMMSGSGLRTTSLSR